MAHRARRAPALYRGLQTAYPSAVPASSPRRLAGVVHAQDLTEGPGTSQRPPPTPFRASVSEGVPFPLPGLGALHAEEGWVEAGLVRLPWCEGRPGGHNPPAEGQDQVRARGFRVPPKMNPLRPLGHRCRLPRHRTPRYELLTPLCLKRLRLPRCSRQAIPGTRSSAGANFPPGTGRGRVGLGTALGRRPPRREGTRPRDPVEPAGALRHPVEGA